MFPLYAQFRRKFALSMYKNMQIALGEMSFFKDFIHDTRGDLYPLAYKSADCLESIHENHYHMESGNAERVFCQFFPFATYEIKADLLCGEMGFAFRLPDAEAFLSVTRDEIGAKFHYRCKEHIAEYALPTEWELSLIVTCRPGAFDLYHRKNGKAEYLTSVEETYFSESNRYTAFRDGYASLCVSGKAILSQVLSYLDNGVSIADFRPIKNEDGTVIQEAGKTYFTASIRMQTGSYQAVFSWVPGTMQFEMTGAVFFDCGDGFWRGYLASTFVYHREQKKWLIWTSSFDHKHILAYGTMDGDPRFGLNVADVTVMEKAGDGSDITDFVGFRGDEDPDLIFDHKNNRWLLAICRVDDQTKKYVYMFYESNDPFTGFRYIGQGVDGASETGGCFLRAKGEIYFICGNDFDKRSEYRIYSKEGMQLANFRYPDGGFRGWGCVMPLQCGSRIRYFWLTFDRHNGSAYRWSYGNVYCFEAD